MRTDIQLKPVNEVLNTLPKMVALEDINIEGNIIGRESQRTGFHIGNHKMVGHIENDGQFVVVPTVKSMRYSEISHDYTLGTISDTLDRHGIKHGIWKNEVYQNNGIMRTDILLDKPYKINEDVFESDFGARYNEDDTHTKGLYQPMVRLVNSFYAASTIEFALVRIMCKNGMMRVADSTKIKFQHAGDIISTFERKTDQFINNIFTKHTIENIIVNLSEQPVSLGIFMDWFLEEAGQRTTKQVNEKFNLTFADKTNMINMWIAYNMMTWAISNCRVSKIREQRMFNKFNELTA